MVVQGLSGVNFSLGAAPTLSLLIPGSAAIGLVNLLASVQSVGSLWLAGGSVRWDVLRRIGPGLLAGFVAGAVPLYVIDPELRPVIVAVSALGSLVLLFWFNPSEQLVDSPIAAAVWGGASNTYAGVGEAAVEGYFRRQKWQPEDFQRTLALSFGVLNLASIPLLGLPIMAIWQAAILIALVPAGLLVGLLLGRVIPQAIAVRFAQVAIAIVGLGCLVRAVTAIP